MHEGWSYNDLWLAGCDSVGPASNHGACWHSLRTRAREGGTTFGAIVYVFMNEMGAVPRISRSRPLWSRLEPGSWKTENCGGSRKYKDPLWPTEYFCRKIRVAKKPSCHVKTSENGGTIWTRGNFGIWRFLRVLVRQLCAWSPGPVVLQAM